MVHPNCLGSRTGIVGRAFHLKPRCNQYLGGPHPEYLERPDLTVHLPRGVVLVVISTIMQSEGVAAQLDCN